MAKKSSKAESMGTLFFVLLILFVILLPIVMLLAIPYFAWQRYRIKLEPKNTIADYWLSDVEKDQFMQRRERWLPLYAQLKEIERKIENVHAFAEENNLSRNVDGSYSRRSDMGKSVMNTLDELNAKRERVAKSESEAYENFLFWVKKPIRDWERDEEAFRERDFLYRKAKIASIGFALWGVLYLIFTQSFYYESSSSMLLNALIVPVVVAILYFYHNKQNQKLEYPVPCPPEVDLDNINDYSKTEGVLDDEAKNL